MQTDKVTKTNLPCADQSSPKGRSTFEWHLPNDHQVTVYFRKKGENAGGHYHKGTDPSKRPELFLLLSGKVSIHACYPSGEGLGLLLDATEHPVELVIPPLVFHTFVAETDITYIEYRVTRFDKNTADVHGIEKWRESVWTVT